MTIVINREFTYEVETIAGFHQSITFTVSGESDGSMRVQFCGDKPITSFLDKKSGTLVIGVINEVDRMD